MIIHLVGAQHSNYPWGFENRLVSAIRQLGHDVLDTDFRQERDRLPELLQQKADMILVCKGEGINPHLIESSPCITSLWYAEQIGTPDRYDDTALSRRKELTFNVQAFDYVFSHDPANLLVYKRLEAERVNALPCAAVDPALNRKLDLPKKYDVVFVGSKTPRRRKLLETLEHKGINLYSPDIWNAEDMNRLFNESRIVINLHLSDLLNTETRVAEVLGSGSFLLSETLSDLDLVDDGKHFIGFTPGDTNELAEKIRYYLNHEREMENIARQGYQHIHENHTYATRIQKILNTVDFSFNHRIWPAYIIGVPTNVKMKPTLRIDRYNAAVRERLLAELKLSDQFIYSQEFYDTEYHNGRLGLDVRSFDEIRSQYEHRPYYQRMQYIFDLLNIPQSGINWLEVGCHVGMTAYWASCRYPEARLYMFDFSETAINWLKKEFPFQDRAVIWQTSVENIRLADDGLDASMDIVTCMDVTEHLPEPIYRNMIAELKRVMKPGGLLIFLQGTAPNDEHIHILKEEQIDEDFLASGFEKVTSPQPELHFFRKPIESAYVKNQAVQSTQGQNSVKQLQADFSTCDHWNERYKNGGNSGNGSYGRLASFKAAIINDFISEKNIKSAIEFGVGDGHNLGFYKIDDFLGLDVSPKVIEICKNRYQNDGSKQFAVIKPLDEFSCDRKFDCSLSIDVLYHLVEQDVYETHLNNLFASSDKFVIIYAWDTDEEEGMNLSVHVKPRKFTKYISSKFSNWELIGNVKQIYKESSSDFFFYEKSPAPLTANHVHRKFEDRPSFIQETITFDAYKNDGWGLSKLAFRKLYDIIDDNSRPSFRIIEFGSGISTKFLIDCALKMIPKQIEILSFDNDPEYMFKSSPEYYFFNLLLRKLIECDDDAYELMFENKHYSRNLMHDKNSPLTTRQKNNFYDIKSRDIHGHYDLMILDGPNGNGRNIAFLHMIGHLKSGSYVFIDDFTHYDFIERFKSIYMADEIFRHEGGMSNQWDNGGDFIIYKLA